MINISTLGCLPRDFHSEIKVQKPPALPPGFAARFKLVPFEDIAPSTSPRWLVRDLLPRVGLVVAYGEPKCGKSFWALDLALHVAHGWEYRSRSVRQGAVIYIACEGQGSFADRVEAWRLAKRQEDPAPDPVPFLLLPQRIELVADAAALAADIAEQTEQSPVLIVIDTLARSYTGKEADDEAMGTYVRAAELLRDRFACAVLVVHHSGWSDKDRYRGSSALRGAYDTGILVERDAAGRVVATVKDQKDGPADAVIVSQLRAEQVATDSEGQPVTSCYIVPADSADLLPRRVKLPPQSQKALQILVNAIAEEGEHPPIAGFPADLKAIRLEVWADHCRKRGLSAADDPDSQARVFRDVRKKLNDNNVISINQPWVWPVCG